ncbi:macrophage mannose receptor 1-like [Betta splendens]|uniref:Macrophage mannose receptor 1-like n=1 Tax=Betta splendens TaxID=158456 RepID=A0A6P7KV32_BETSP|nr:macrophage mannose receptor 1-like [Betta splendens]XP_055359358.1 macrophage mannose receptor 1-like [Betta splendens]
MDHQLPATVLLFVFCNLPTGQLRQFHYVNLTMTWSNAQQYCRANYTDLATFNSMNEISSLNRPALSTSVAWIGLNDDPKGWMGVMASDANSWRWSATGAPSTTGYQSWATGEPNDQYIEYCVIMGNNGLWADVPCNALFSFVCYSAKTQTYVYVRSALTWSDARNYCRVNFNDLPTIDNSVDNENIRSKIPSAVWIGLYRLAWKWSDGSSSSFTNWQSGKPDNKPTNNQYCVAENNQHQWYDDVCQNKYAFICQEDLKEYMTVKIKLQTSADMTDPATNGQLIQKLDAELQSIGVTYITVKWISQPWKLDASRFSVH